MSYMIVKIELTGGMATSLGASAHVQPVCKSVGLARISQSVSQPVSRSVSRHAPGIRSDRAAAVHSLVEARVVN